MNKSNSFSKGPRTSKVWKSKKSIGYSNFVTLQVRGSFLKNTASINIFCGSNIPDKNSKLVLYYKKKLVKTQLLKNLDGKNFYFSKNLDGKNHYHPMGKTTTIQVFDHRTKNFDGKNHYHPSFWSHDQKLGQ